MYDACARMLPFRVRLLRAAWPACGAMALLAFGSVPANAQMRSLENPSFELNDPAGPGAPNYEILPDTSVPGWATTTGERGRRSCRSRKRQERKNAR